ncbi:MAG: response regulator [Planctomycetota bacterium]|jgi:CheY-like chemotaxis protein|nr:response regulator [Planctomycetota bacterium]
MPPPAEEPNAPATVLVVDDTPLNLLVARGLLERRCGVVVDGAGGGEEALAKIASGKRYAAIFMDQLMPGLDGVETMQKIRALSASPDAELATYAGGVPIIALTADTTAGNEATFIRRGFQGFLSKPINIKTLTDLVDKWVRKTINN